jgi:hypothetical protein
MNTGFPRWGMIELLVELLYAPSLNFFGHNDPGHQTR